MNQSEWQTDLLHEGTHPASDIESDILINSVSFFFYPAATKYTLISYYIMIFSNCKM